MKRCLIVLAISAWLSIVTGMPAFADPVEGLKVDVYTFDPRSLPDHQITDQLIPCATDTAWTSVPSINDDWADGIVAGCQGDFVAIHYTGYLTLPVTGSVALQSWADDGFYLSLDGEPVIQDWTLKGCGGSTVQHDFVAGVSQRLDAWWYEYGGGACNILSYRFGDLAGAIPASAYSQDPAPAVQPSLIPPQNVTVVAEGTTLHVKWDAPETDTPIEHYAVTWTYGDNPGWGISASETSADITGLPEATEVSVQVRSDNDSLGVYSAYSDPVVASTGVSVVIQPTPPPVIPEPPVDPEPPVNPQPPVVPEPPIVPEPPVVDVPVVLPPVVIPDPPVEEPTSQPANPEPLPSITELNPAEIDPTTLTAEDVALLIDTANATLETATPGSPEYVEALAQLFLAAQADDIVVDPQIAGIPVFGATVVALTDAINYLGNVGADMSPKARATAKKEVIAAVIVTQVATSAVAVASISSSSSIRRNK